MITDTKKYDSLTASQGIGQLGNGLNPQSNKRSMLLSTAESAVNGSREQDYGSVEDNFQLIADFWSTYLKGKRILAGDISVIDVALMMDLLKTARLASTPGHVDSWIDKMGYSACGGATIA